MLILTGVDNTNTAYTPFATLKNAVNSIFSPSPVADYAATQLPSAPQDPLAPTLPAAPTLPPAPASPLAPQSPSSLATMMQPYAQNLPAMQPPPVVPWYKNWKILAGIAGGVVVFGGGLYIITR